MLVPFEGRLLPASAAQALPVNLSITASITVAAVR
jgi:hypothetical protein